MKAHLFCLLVCCPALAWSTVSLQSFSVTSSQSNDLFVTISSAQIPNLQNADAVWPVTVNLPFLATLPATLNLNLPDHPAVTVKRNRAQQRGAKPSRSGRDCPDKLCGARFVTVF